MSLASTNFRKVMENDKDKIVRDYFDRLISHIDIKKVLRDLAEEMEFRSNFPMIVLNKQVTGNRENTIDQNNHS